MIDPVRSTTRYQETTPRIPQIANADGIYEGQTFRRLICRIVSFVVMFINIIKNYCVKFTTNRNSETFTYEPGQYALTLQRCVKDNNVKQLQAWVRQFSHYTPTQVVLGKHFTNIDMLRNYFAHQAKTAGVVKSEEEIALALRQFMDSNIRALIMLFHPDRHIHSTSDKDLMNACTRLITSAKSQLQ